MGSKTSRKIFQSLKQIINKLLWKVNIVKRKFLKRSLRKEIENIENILQILWKSQVTVC